MALVENSSAGEEAADGGATPCPLPLPQWTQPWVGEALVTAACTEV